MWLYALYKMSYLMPLRIPIIDTLTGTTSKVHMILSGDQDDTSPRLLFDDKRDVLQRGSVDVFIMAVHQPLGLLTHLR